MVHGENGGTRLGDAQVYLNYSNDGFGSNVVANGNIEVTMTGILEGELVEGLPLYEIINITDNTAGRVAITTGYLYDSSPSSANELTTTPQAMLHVKLAIVSTSASAGLSFSNPDPPAQPTMQGQQYQSDNSTKYDSVIADDTDDSALDPIAVDLVSFTAELTNNQVLLEWQTANEINHAGFNVYKSAVNEENYIKLNSGLIMSSSENQLSGATYRYSDKLSEEATYFYKLQSVDLNGSMSFHPSIHVQYTTSVAQQEPLPSEFRLEQNYPNPFNPETRIFYQVPVESLVDIAIYNVQGRLIHQLVSGTKAPGRHVVVWDGLDKENNSVGSGIYLLKMSATDFQQTKRITLLR